MKSEQNKRIIKKIRISADQCTGCRSCEAICSAFHSEPKHNIVNPKRARIQIFRNEEDGLHVPVFAGQYTETECNGRNVTLINGREYGECSFCRASCPSRDLFHEPDAPDIPLKCDMCGEPPPPEGPLCVKWCLRGALTYVEEGSGGSKD